MSSSRDSALSHTQPKPPLYGLHRDIPLINHHYRTWSNYRWVNGKHRFIWHRTFGYEVPAINIIIWCHMWSSCTRGQSFRVIFMQTDLGGQQDTISGPRGEWHRGRAAMPYYQGTAFDHASRLDQFLHEHGLGRQDRAPLPVWMSAMRMQSAGHQIKNEHCFSSYSRCLSQLRCRFASMDESVLVEKTLTYVSRQRNSLHRVLVSIVVSLTEKVSD
jgi:hypothetical protein